MSNQELIEFCRKLRLPYTKHQIEIGNLPEEQELKWLRCLLENEMREKQKAKEIRLYKQATFPSLKELDDYEWGQNISFPHEDTKKCLVDLSFIKNKENAVLVGTPGTGKTHLATALGVKAIRQGINVKFWRVSDLVDELERSWSGEFLTNFKHKISKYQMIILDEMGYVPFSRTGAELLFQLISEWYETKSVIITSNLEFSQWNKVFIDPKLTAALVDRLIHHAHIVSFTGESYRLKNALSRK